MNKLANAGELKLLEPGVLPGDQTTATFTSYFSGITTTIFALAASLAVLMITVGGVQYIMSGRKEEAKARIASALIGLFLLIIIALILETINPSLLSLNAFLTAFKETP